MSGAASEKPVAEHTCGACLLIFSPTGDASVDRRVELRLLWRGVDLRLMRKASESLDTLFARMALSLTKQKRLKKSAAAPKPKKKTAFDHIKGKKKQEPLKQENEEAVPAATGPPSTAPDTIGTPADQSTNIPEVSSPSDFHFIDSNGSSLEDSTSLDDAIRRATILEIAGQELRVIKTTVTVVGATLAYDAIAGCPAVARIDFAGNKPDTNEEYLVEWYVTRPSNPDNVELAAKFDSLESSDARFCPGSSDTEGCAGTQGMASVKCVGKGLVFWPSEDLGGLELQVKIFPALFPCLAVWSAKYMIKLPPRRSWYDARLDAFARTGSAASVRVGTYNILADEYARSPFARDLCFPYCSAEIIAFERRAPLIARTIARMDCDIVCLQECSAKFLSRGLTPFFEEKYELLFVAKRGRVNEGCATLVDRSKFELVSSHDCYFADIFEAMAPELVDEIRNEWPHFLNEVLPRMTAVFQINLLQSSLDVERMVLIANTHLFFHPRANHIRLLQVLTLARKLEQVYNDFSAEFPNKKITVILTGDLNATMEGAAYRLLRDKKVSAAEPDWLDGREFFFNAAVAEDEDVEMVVVNAAPPSEIPVPSGPGKGWSLELPPQMFHLIDAYAETPNEITNAVNGFEAALDHLFLKNASVSKVIPPADRADLREAGGLPSDVSPSDHLPIAAELILNS